MRGSGTLHLWWSETKGYPDRRVGGPPSSTLDQESVQQNVCILLKRVVALSPATLPSETVHITGCNYAPDAVATLRTTAQYREGLDLNKAHTTVYNLLGAATLRIRIHHRDPASARAGTNKRPVYTPWCRRLANDGE